MSAILKFIRENHILALIEQAIVKKKSKLSLNAFEITDIPNLLYDCMDVEHLYLHRNKITTIPVQITELLNLTTLTLDYNNISSLPAEIGNLKNLVNLNLSYNPLEVLIPEVCELENLEAFWCNKIGLREIPKEIGKLSKLDTFGARGNELKTIPDEMTKLNKLRWLTLENNKIETLPSTMDQMEALVHCNLRNNEIREFPSSVLKCVDLMFLQLNNNQISSLPEDFDTSFLAVLEMIDLRNNPICELSHPEHALVRYTEELPNPPASPEVSPSSSGRGAGAGAGAAASAAGGATPVLAVNATALRLPAVPAPRHPDPIVAEMSNSAASPELCGSSTDRVAGAGAGITVASVAPELVVNGTAMRLPDVPVLRHPDPIVADIDLDASSLESSEDWENSVNSSELDVMYQSDEDRVENEAVGMVLPELSRYASTAS